MRINDRTDDRAALWRKQVDKIINRIHRLSPDEKDDLQQECYLAVLETAKKLEVAALGAKNTVEDIVRARVRTSLARRRRREEEIGLEQADGLEVEGSERFAEVMAEADLDEAEREVLEMMFVEGMSETKIAERKGQTRWWVRSLKRSGMEKIRRSKG